MLQQKSFGILFPKLDQESTSIKGYSDAGFATNKDLTSRLGMVVVLLDKFENAAIMHYSSWKSRRVVRSILAAEVYALSACHDFCQILSHDLSRITGKKFEIYLRTDAKSIFDTITKLSTVSEKRPLIDISSLESYCSGEIQNFGHVLSKYNLADPFTTEVKSENLEKVTEKGKLSHPINL